MTTRNRNMIGSQASMSLGRRITFVVDDDLCMADCETCYDDYKETKPDSVVEVAVPSYVSAAKRNRILRRVEHNRYIYGRIASPREFRTWWMKWSSCSVILGVLSANGALLTYYLGFDGISPTALLSVSVVFSLSSPILRWLDGILLDGDYRLVRWIDCSVLSVVCGVFTAMGGVLMYIFGLSQVIPTVMFGLSMVVFVFSNYRRVLGAVRALFARCSNWSVLSIICGVFIALGGVLTYVMKLDQAIPTALFGIALIVGMSSNTIGRLQTGLTIATLCHSIYEKLSPVAAGIHHGLETLGLIGPRPTTKT